MKNNKLILNIQLFADGEGEAGEFVMRNSECRMDEAGGSDALNEKREKGKENEAVETDALKDEASNEEEKENIEEAEALTDSDESGLQEREARLRSRISGWLKESGEIKQLYPDFDLRQELRSSQLFSRLVLAGAPVRAAYEVVHKDEILSGAMAYTAGRVREQVVRSIEAKGRRPLENGISAEGAVATAVDVNALTPKDILKILKQVENGASIKF